VTKNRTIGLLVGAKYHTSPAAAADVVVTDAGCEQSEKC